MPPKTVLITGCSEGGIGAALALEFQLQGLRVFATARDVTKMQSLASKGIETFALDVTSASSIAAVVAAVSKTTGGTLDFLINNAGVNHILPFVDATVDDFRRVIDTNVVAVFAVTHAFLPLLIEAKGTVASIGSINETFCPPFQSLYTSSKAAVHAWSNTLRVELQPLGVKFITLMTGAVRSNLFDNCPSKVPLDSPYAPIAKSIEEREFLKHATWVDAPTYAKRVVGDLLKPKPSWTIWRGGMATLAWVFTWFGWDGMMMSTMIKGSHLEKVVRR